MGFCPGTGCRDLSTPFAREVPPTVSGLPAKVTLAIHLMIGGTGAAAAVWLDPIFWWLAADAHPGRLSQHRDGVHWELEIHGGMAGLDYRARFRLPVLSAGLPLPAP